MHGASLGECPRIAHVVKRRCFATTSRQRPDPITITGWLCVSAVRETESKIEWEEALRLESHLGTRRITSLVGVRVFVWVLGSTLCICIDVAAQLMLFACFESSFAPRHNMTPWKQYPDTHPRSVRVSVYVSTWRLPPLTRSPLASRSRRAADEMRFCLKATHQALLPLRSPQANNRSSGPATACYPMQTKAMVYRR